MVLESKWADVPDVPPSGQPDKSSRRKAKPKTPRKKGPRDRKIPEKEQNSPAPRLTFSLKDKPATPTDHSDKNELLKKKIEEQRKIYEKNQHQKQQKQLLDEFLNGDTKLQWSDEDEEDEILAKLNKSLKI
ncbi:hypothetical protein HG536_0H00940 [Torulaspora globosa]|uniref:Uncharacterized protein n=1 Tax=Torulaspora globosa TaxID=48254 RepID=A0A7G3ZMI3_9SACH|nr:uncharacterized protein HG536_0H00940 [Torulaspora globosa]QLL34719.1 hypothetical protein HG536_0H00940 [Torulaspora globosa]